MKAKTKVSEYNFRDIKALKFGEELGNSISHGVPALLIVFTLPYFAVKTYLSGGAMETFSISVYLISIFLMLFSSCIYHLMPPKSQHKYIMRIIDHSMIYVAIAGTYTPVALLMVGGKLGAFVMIIEWLIAISGILYKSLAKNVHPKASLAIYLIMGWLGVILFPSMIHTVSIAFLGWILAGGIMYTVGSWFYAQKNRHYFHMIWHFFILLGAFCHFIGLLYFIN